MLPMEFVLVTPEGEAARLACDSVNLFAADNANGENGGSVGIHRGHLPAVIALEKGSAVIVKAEGREIFRAKTEGGFAHVRDDRVTVLTEGCSVEGHEADA